MDVKTNNLSYYKHLKLLILVILTETRNSKYRRKKFDALKVKSLKTSKAGKNNFFLFAIIYCLYLNKLPSINYKLLTVCI